MFDLQGSLALVVQEHLLVVLALVNRLLSGFASAARSLHVRVCTLGILISQHMSAVCVLVCQALKPNKNMVNPQYANPTSDLRNDKVRVRLNN